MQGWDENYREKVSPDKEKRHTGTSLVIQCLRLCASNTSAYANAGSSLRSPPGYSRASPPQKNQSLPTVLLCALTSDFTGGCPPPPSRSLCHRVNLQLQFIKFLVILPFNFQLSLHLERGTHHAY